MRHGLADVEHGLERNAQLDRDRQQRFLQKRAAELGLSLVPAPLQTSRIHEQEPAQRAPRQFSWIATARFAHLATTTLLKT